MEIDLEQAKNFLLSFNGNSSEEKGDSKKKDGAKNEEKSGEKERIYDELISKLPDII